MQRLSRTPRDACLVGACGRMRRSGQIRDRSVRPGRLADSVIEARTGQDNELWHLLILGELVAASDARENRSGSG